MARPPVTQQRFSLPPQSGRGFELAGQAIAQRRRQKQVGTLLKNLQGQGLNTQTALQSPELAELQALDPAQSQTFLQGLAIQEKGQQERDAMIARDLGLAAITTKERIAQDPENARKVLEGLPLDKTLKGEILAEFDEKGVAGIQDDLDDLIRNGITSGGISQDLLALQNKTLLEDEQGNAVLSFTDDLGRIRTEPLPGLKAPVQKQQQISPAVKSKTQKELVDLMGTKNSITEIKDLFKPEFLTVIGRAKGATLAAADRVGLLGKEKSQFLADKTQFDKAVKQSFAEYRKAITGAAAAQAELVQLEQTLFNLNMGPQQFEAALDLFERKIDKAIELRRRFTTDQGKLLVPKDQFSQILDQEIKKVGSIEAVINQDNKEARSVLSAEQLQQQSNQRQTTAPPGITEEEIQFLLDNNPGATREDIIKELGGQ